MATIMMSDNSTESHCLLIGENFKLTRPETLIEGEYYVCLDGRYSYEPAIPIAQFIAYTSCPAIVVVSNGSGQRVRCPRDRLFNRQPETNIRINGINDGPG